jgi:hypothetical protein
MLLMRKRRELQVRRRCLLMMAILGWLLLKIPRRVVLEIWRRLRKLVLLILLLSNSLLVLTSGSRAEHVPHEILQPRPRDLDSGVAKVLAARATLKDGLVAIVASIAVVKGEALQLSLVSRLGCCHG